MYKEDPDDEGPLVQTLAQSNTLSIVLQVFTFHPISVLETISSFHSQWSCAIMLVYEGECQDVARQGLPKRQDEGLILTKSTG